MARVYNAVVSSPNWPNTVLIINFDEWGGFFDHVRPEPADCIPAAQLEAETEADTLGLRGFREPCLIISPFARRGYVAKGLYDHASVLKFIESLWGLAPLTCRDPMANNLGEVLDLTHSDLNAAVVNVPQGPFGHICKRCSTPPPRRRGAGN